MSDTQTPLATWQQNPDGSWEPTRTSGVRNPNKSGGSPGGGSAFLTEFEVIGGDNIVIEHLGNGSIVLHRGGHTIAHDNIPVGWQPELNFLGDGVTVEENATGGSIDVTISQPNPGINSMIFRGEWDALTTYQQGDVVTYQEGLFIFGGSTHFGYGYGPYGSGPYGSGGAGGPGYGSGGYGSGGYGL